MALEVLQYPDPRLKNKSEPITEITPEIKALAKEMAEAMYENDGIGLAAPQVGHFVRMVVIDLSGPSERSALKVYINPEIEVLDDEELESEEGCLSVPDLRSTVTRAAKVRVKALDLDGNPFEEEGEELQAICFQHEFDHLDGVLFIDRISRLKRRLYDDKLKKKLRREGK